MSNMKPFSVANAQQLAEMPQEYRDLVLHQLRQHTEGELVGAQDYLDFFYPLAPNGYERKICCERAAEEMDHYIRGAEVLEEMGYDAAPMLEKSIHQRQYYKTEGVVKVDTWLKRGFFSFIGEAAVLALIEEMAVSSYAPIAHMTRQVVMDEYVHVAHGQRIVEEFIAKHGPEAAQADFEFAWPLCLDLFGNSQSDRSEAYLKWGLRRYSNAEARERFIAHMTPKFVALGLKMPDPMKGRKFL